MKTISRCALFAALFAVSASPVDAGELKLAINNGLVTIVADEVPVASILAEWARVGQTRIVNGEKLMTTVSLELVDVPEKKALEIVLRSASGFMAAERKQPIEGASAFDRVVILPFSQPPAYTPTAVTQTVPQPFVNRQVMTPPELEDLQHLSHQAQQPANAPQTLPQPGMLPQPIGPGGQQAPITSPRPGFLPPPAPPKPPGGGGGSDQ
jgi:hypothetical protein